MGHKSRLPLAIALLLFSLGVTACREGPYTVPTPTPTFNKTFVVIEDPLPDAGESQGPNLTAPTAAAQPPAAAKPPAAGPRVFDQNCNMCHPGGGAGMGPALKGGKTTEQSFRQVVRAGKGAMPAYGTDRISDSDLEAMWSYIKDLK